MSQPIPKETLAYEKFVDGLRRSNAKLLKACHTLAEDCRMTLSGEWDKGDQGFQDSLELLESVIAEAEDRPSLPPAKTITIHIEGGLVQDVNGIPAGYELRVEDYDYPDDTQPTWDAEKECHVTVYEGGGV